MWVGEIAVNFTPFKKKVWLSSPTMHGDELKYMKLAYDTNWMSTLGENINQIEQIFCEEIGCNCAVSLASGTSALHMAVKLAQIKQGEKVFCTDMTFSATVNPVIYEGGEPVFIDTERDTWNMDPDALERAFKKFPDTTERTDLGTSGTLDYYNQAGIIHNKYLSKNGYWGDISIPTNLKKGDYSIKIYAKTLEGDLVCICKFGFSVYDSECEAGEHAENGQNDERVDLPGPEF